ncbi:hypothetical protein [Deinococcus saxicola]|uniref:hypothetical protein n=1 Tax=Deinococcus saxicola TaxID=249406 RepID=UPI0039F00B91
MTTYVLFVSSSAPSIWAALCALQNAELFTGSVSIELPDDPQDTPDPGSAAAQEVQQVLQVFATARKELVVLQSLDEPSFLNALWQELWPSARHALSFRRHFHPREISSSLPNPQLILVADSTSWVREPGFQVIRPQVNSVPPAPVMVGAEFQGSLNQLRPYVNLTSGLQRLPEADLSELQHLWGLLASVPLTEAFSTQHEAQLSARIAARMPGAAPEDFLTLLGIPDLHGTLSSAVTAWMRSRLTAHRPLPDENWVQQVVGGNDWLLAGLQAGLRAQRPSKDAAQILWRWLSFKAGRDLLSVLDDAWEQVFTRTLPADAPTMSSLSRWAAQRGWWTLHGLVETHKDLANGLRSIFEKTPPSQLQGVLHTVRAVTDDRDLLQTLEQLGSVAAQTLAADMVTDNATLRTMIRADSAWWQQVWTQALPAFHGPFDGLPNPEQLQRTLIDEQAAHGQVPESLLIAVANTGAHLLNHPNRAALWSKFPATFLNNTAAAYVAARSSPGQPDAALLNAIHSSEQPISSDEAAQELVGHIPDLTDGQARDVLQRLRPPARQHVDRTHVQSHKFLDRLYAGMSERIPEWLVPALPDEMKLERAARLSETLPDDLWWTLAFRIIPGKIQEGPYNFWLAAKGKADVLEENGTTRTKWVAALNTSRATDKPSIIKLLNEILQSYDVSQVQQLKQTKRGKR